MKKRKKNEAAITTSSLSSEVESKWMEEKANNKERSIKASHYKSEEIIRRNLKP